MYKSNKIEKIKSRKNLEWYEEGQGRKGDKRNKPRRDRSQKREDLTTD